ncbi:hypothetical protein A3F02_00150 [Candidatus Curtissbacteria bacterium RIFCSPHIGHO2_12_FULL_38_9b]|uniref:Uncharacterized protein n=2 Tax=Candidatus Curtissiibacteriota TaxID=1752717 RepID=A0A1F5GX44_9BACT|nr:MAG: hypothetical protein A3A48_03100 [Candidatus Curtissbacteria bacterium RIFCSPLOWO2_01_FULL_37_9]OGD96482.1 MAG: hypothetical protein A3F02_00150 [Candidatus Curtissbacteria bacterium RIFCSPHIGHO2_12_FULL_38_9b]
MFPKTAIAVSGKRIRLTEERWNHIEERHPEVAGKLPEILTTIAEPDMSSSALAERHISDSTCARLIYNNSWLGRRVSCDKKI